jgi:spore coat polysaccharide biosynthesis predicted glycosyltransferase SpsG/RimJ/RimL family protein N-acetyltransferase
MLARHQVPPSDRPHLALRAEGGPGRGAGHLARCLALGQAWVHRGGRATLVAATVPEPWDARYLLAGIDVVDPGAGAAVADARWWVVDGYDLDATGHPRGAHLARIDDHGRSPRIGAEVVLDQNLGATAAPYQGELADLLLGTRYALLRRELVEVAPVARGRERHLASGPPTTVVVAMGGVPDPSVRAWFDAVVRQLAADGALELEVLSGAQDPVPAYAAAGLALAPAGSTAWELALFGVPAVLVAVAENQEPLGEAIAERGAGRYLGPVDEVTPATAAAEVRRVAVDLAQRDDLAEAAAELVDGRGAARVATRLRAGLLALRPVGADDAAVVHRLNDDPASRAASRSTAPIPWADHQRWFAARLADPRAHLYLAHDGGGELVGLVRFQIDEAAPVAEVGVVVAVERRRRGWGGPLVDAGVRRLLQDLAAAGAPDAVLRIDAHVRAENRGSQEAFLDADFDRASAEVPGWLRYARHHVPRADG